MKTVKNLILVLLVLLIAIQFFHPPINYPPDSSPNDIATIYKVTGSINIILENGCRDCHSDYTRFRWYNNIQPFAWWLNSKVQRGKRSLNFNIFGTYPISKQYELVQDIVDEVKKGDMPLGLYSAMHSKGKLSKEDKTALYKWAVEIRDTIKMKYPTDSISGKK